MIKIQIIFDLLRKLRNMFRPGLTVVDADTTDFVRLLTQLQARTQMKAI